MRFLLLSSILLFLFVVSTDAQRKRPSKRKTANPVFTVKGDINFTAASPPEKLGEETSVGPVIENYVSSYLINADGTGTETREVQQRCSSVICVAGNNSMRQVYNGDLQKVRVLEAYILKADGTKSKVPESAITDRPTDQAEAAPGFSSLREMRVSFEGFAVGDASYIKLETSIFRPTFEGKFDGLETFPITYDWKSIRIDISAPATLPLFIEAIGLEGGKVADEGGRSRWQYKKLDIRKIAPEAAMQDVTAISPRFALTTFPNADALGSVFWSAVKKKAVVTPEIQQLADEITKDASTPSQQASAIYDWANKNIRYLFIVLDRGGWIPHSSTEIIKNGYGDCKDYATIIHTLLKAKGIDSIPVLIRSDMGTWFPSVSTADYFNHVILYIPSLDTFADATTPNTRLGLISQTLVGKSGVLSGEKTGIIQLPKDNPDGNQMLSDLSVSFEPNGSLKARSKNTFIGRSEILFRPMFNSSGLQRDAGTFVKVLLAYYGLDGEGDIISVGNPHKVGEAFNVELETRIRNFTTFLPKGRLEIPPGLNMISTGSMELLTRGESRKTSIIIGASRIRENMTINLPSTVKLVSAPPAVDFLNAVGSLRVTGEIKDGSLRFSRELVFRKDVIDPLEYPLLKELVKKVTDSSTLAFDYSADSSLLRAKSKELRAAPKGKASETPSVFDDLYRPSVPTKLSAAEVRRLEAKLATKPDDLETRRTLIDHYSMDWYPKPAQAEAMSVRHRVWLIEHNPEIDDSSIFGFSRQEFSKASIELLKTAWTAKVAEQKDSPEIRINAINSLRVYARDAAISMAEEGVKLDPENYQIMLLIADIGADEMSEVESNEAADRAARRTLAHGSRALALLKKERSDERDGQRAVLLRQLCAAAIRLGDLEAASSFAQELVLDFGRTSSARTYDQAAHIGNTTLGIVELRHNNVTKAKEHLLASIRAPLRMGYNNLPRIETSLAKEMFDKGEKVAVIEYLKLCQTIPNFKIYPESYADELYALKHWIEQIEKGLTPNFDFHAAENRLPLPKGVVRPTGRIYRIHE